jgi:hypothetical protein
MQDLLEKLNFDVPHTHALFAMQMAKMTLQKKCISLMEIAYGAHGATCKAASINP